MKKIFYSLTFILTLSFAITAQAEQLQLTTYYPAPYGAYDKLLLVPRTPLSGSCQTGTLYMEDIGNGDGEIRLCDKGIWAPISGHWKQENDDIFLVDTATNPDLFVGIGTTNPGARLSVQGYGNSATTASLNMTNSDGNSILYARDDRNVGIGTTNPSANLDINNNGDLTGDPLGSNLWFRLSGGSTIDHGRIWAQYSNTQAPILVMEDDDDPSRIQFQQVGTGTESTPEFVSWVGMGKKNSSDIALMGGKVGIGTTDPLSNLHIKAPSPSIILEREDNAQAAALAFFPNGAISPTNMYWAMGLNLNSNHFVIANDSNTSFPNNIRFTIKDDGKVAMGGNHIPQTDLHIKGNGVLRLEDTSVAIDFINENSGDDNFSIASWGGSKDMLRFRSNKDGTWDDIVQFESDGDVWVEDDVTADEYKTHSDVRLKKNILPLTDALSRVTQLRGVNYQWRDTDKDQGKIQMGLIAQEVEEVFPEVVSTDEDGFKSVAYSKLVAALIEAVKELKAENDDLKLRIEKIEK